VFSCSTEPRHRALPRNLALKLGEGPEEVKRQPSLCGGGVDAFGETDELDAALIERFDLGDQVFQRAAEAVQTPDDEGIALAEVLQALIELRTARCLARDRIPVRLLAICRF